MPKVKKIFEVKESHGYITSNGPFIYVIDVNDNEISAILLYLKLNSSFNYLKFSSIKAEKLKKTKKLQFTDLNKGDILTSIYNITVDDSSEGNHIILKKTDLVDNSDFQDFFLEYYLNLADLNNNNLTDSEIIEFKRDIKATYLSKNIESIFNFLVKFNKE